MKKKSKFQPRVTRIKLNPEQAVLLCYCYNTGFYPWSSSSYRGWALQDLEGRGYASRDYCMGGQKSHGRAYNDGAGPYGMHANASSS